MGSPERVSAETAAEQYRRHGGAGAAPTGGVIGMSGVFSGRGGVRRSIDSGGIIYYG